MVPGGGEKQSVTFWQRDMFRLLKERDKNSATAGHLPRIKYLQKIAGRTNPNLCKPVQFDTILPLLCNWKGVPVFSLIPSRGPSCHSHIESGQALFRTNTDQGQGSSKALTRCFNPAIDVGHTPRGSTLKLNIAARRCYMT